MGEVILDQQELSPRAYSWEAKYPGASEELIACSCKGMTSTQTAAFLSHKYGTRITRNAVIGRWHRMGMQVGKEERIRRFRAALKEHYKLHPRPSAIARRGQKSGTLQPKNILPEQWLPDSPVGLMDLKNCSCRWPFGTPGEPDFRFCGRPEADMTADPVIPYCREHMAMAPAPKQPARLKSLPPERSYLRGSF